LISFPLEVVSSPVESFSLLRLRL